MKKCNLLSVIVGLGAISAVGAIIMNKKLFKAKEYASNSNSDDTDGIDDNGIDDNGIDKEPTFLYENSDGDIINSPISTLNKYVGKPMPITENLTLYFAAGKERAEQMSKNNALVTLTPSNGRLLCDTTDIFPMYIGICLVSKESEELFLWVKANNRSLSARINDDMYIEKSGCNERCLATLKIMN